VGVDMDPSSSDMQEPQQLDYARPGLPKRKRSKLLTGLGILALLIVLIMVLEPILFPPLGRNREAADRAKCASNLRQLGQLMGAYAADHDGQYPLRLEDLILHAGPRFDPAIVACPSTEHVPGRMVRQSPPRPASIVHLRRRRIDCRCQRRGRAHV